MLRRIGSLFLSAFLPFAQAYAGALGQLESLSQTPARSTAFDGGARRAALAEPARSARPRALSPRALREAKDLLAHGTETSGGPVLPFTFRFPDGGSRAAQSAGLEGFVYEEAEVRRLRGQDAARHHLDDYVRYLDALLAPVSWAADARAEIRRIDASVSNPREKYEALMTFVREYTASLREAVAASDASGWARTARIYEIFPRAYNLEGKRAARDRWQAEAAGGFFAEFGEQDLIDIREKGFDTLWVMGVFPIGKRNAFGSAGGSPYSVSDHAGIHPDLGTREEFAAFVARARRLGLRVIMDFIPNHSSMDSKLLNAHPEYFVHRPAGSGKPPYGYFEQTDPGSGRRLWVRHGGYDSYGAKAYWEDTAQVDYSNPLLRREMVRIVSDWVRETGVDGFRVDMAYQVLNGYYGRNWAGELGGPLPEREFLEELITEVKARRPGTAFIAEGYDGWDQLSRAGFDLVYGKNNMARPGGHHGWYDALSSRDPGWISEAVKRAAFLQWQKGGTDMLNFIGNHDEASPQRAFGPWLPGAVFITMLMPGGTLFYGSQEIGFDYDDPGREDEPKSIPFSVPVKVDWADADQELTRFYNGTFRLARWVRQELGEPEMRPLEAAGGWVGYLLVPRKEGAGRKAVAVLGNPTDRAVQVRISRPELGVAYSGSLAPYGYDLVPL